MQLWNASPLEIKVREGWKLPHLWQCMAGIRRQPKKYRLMNPTFIICKCLEGIIRGQNCKHLVNWCAALTALRGFTLLQWNLLTISDEATKSLKENHRVKVCYMDFCEPFDSFQHGDFDHRMKAVRFVSRTKNLVIRLLRGRTLFRFVGYTTPPPKFRVVLPRDRY